MSGCRPCMYFILHQTITIRSNRFKSTASQNATVGHFIELLVLLYYLVYFDPRLSHVFVGSRRMTPPLDTSCLYSGPDETPESWAD